MSNLPDLDPSPAASGPRRPSGELDWPRLLRAESPAALLDELGCWLGSAALELTLRTHEGAVLSVASWRRTGVLPATRDRKFNVPGSPCWQLVVGMSEVDVATEAMDTAALVAAAWRGARDELSRAETTLTRRTRELNLLQGLARRAAEARTAGELFETVLGAIHHAVELDLAFVGHADREPHLCAYLARPFAESYLDAVRRRVTRFLGNRLLEESAGFSRVQLDGFDAIPGMRERFREQDLLLFPLVRREQPVACLVLVPSREPGESEMRLFYGASNQLSAHLERILNARDAEQDRFRSIVDSMPQGVLLTDARHCLVQANASARRMLEAVQLSDVAEAGELIGHLGLVDSCERVGSGSIAVAEAECCPSKDRVWSVTVSPIHGERRRVDGLVLVLTDISESRRIQRELAQADKMSSLGQMISGVAHELNNPLSSILGYAQLMRATADDPLKERLDILCREADRCRRIVLNLLSFARRREPERTSLSLNQVVRTALSLLAYQMRVETVRIETELCPDIPLIEGDPHQLEQVLVNLLTNARHAIRDSGAPGVVCVRTTTDPPEAVVLEVADDGPGVPEEIRPRIFDPFFTTKPPGAGTGLGLSLVYGIVQSHGGTIELVSSGGRGANFRIRLPTGGSPRHASPQVEDERPAPGACRPGRVLVVDDDEPVARFVCEALTLDGHATTCVTSGDQALDCLEGSEYDLILCDLRMPGISMERMRDKLSESAPHLLGRFVLITGDTLGTDADALSRRTGLPILRKPFDLDDLRRCVRSRMEPG